MLMLDQVKSVDRRLRLVAIGMIAGIVILVGGLWRVQILGYSKYRASLKVQSFRNVRLPAARGKIFDRNGQLLAENQPQFTVNVYLEDLREQFKFAYTNSVKPEFLKAHPGRTKLKRAEVDMLEEVARYRVVSNIVWQVSSNVMGAGFILNPEQFAKHYSARKAMPLPILSGLNQQQLARFAEKCSDLPAVELEALPYRYYPNRTSGAHLIGYARQEDAPEEEEEYSFLYSLPDFVGKTGIEGGFDKDLRGKAGGKALLVNNIGYKQKEEVWLTPQPGKNVMLTIDLDVQKAAERALHAADEDDQRGAAVVIDVRNGDILTLASSPDFDLNMLVNRAGFSPEDWKRFNDRELAPQYNRAVLGAYPPGSIFKIIVAIAGLETGVIKPEELIHSPGVVFVGRRRIKDEFAPAGDYNFKEAFKHSCNYYFIEAGLKVGPEKLVQLGDRMNLAQDGRGYFPAPRQLAKRDGTKWQDGDTANLCIGQGEIAVTPMQMAVMTAAVANGGKVLRPRMVSAIADQETGEIERVPFEPVANHLAVSSQTLETVRAAMLADVAEKGGTGTGAAVPGMDICGKTGTAQIRIGENKLDHITWFVSFAPYNSPRYAVVVMVESGVTGGRTCAPKAKEIYKALQKMEQEKEKTDSRNIAVK